MEVLRIFSKDFKQSLLSNVGTEKRCHEEFLSLKSNGKEGDSYALTLQKKKMKRVRGQERSS